MSTAAEEAGCGSTGSWRSARAPAVSRSGPLGVADAAPAATDPVSLLPRLTTAMVARIQGRDDYEYRWTFTGPRKTGDAYRLGDFKAFIGQENHLRHEAFRNPAKIS